MEKEYVKLSLINCFNLLLLTINRTISKKAANIYQTCRHQNMYGVYNGSDISKEYE